MAFDLATARPEKQGFDLSTAQPVEEVEVDQRQRQSMLSGDPQKFEAFTQGVGKGVSDIGRGAQKLFFGVTGQQEKAQDVRQRQRQATEEFEPLKQQFPVAAGAGEIVGETLPTLPVGLGAAGLARAATTKALPTASRFIAAGAGGGAEGALIGAAEGDEAAGAAIGATSAVAFESALPRLGRLFKRVFGRAIKPDDVGSKEAIESVKAKFESAGLSGEEIAQAMDDVSNLGKADVISDASIKQRARLADFKAENITPAGRSRITQNPDDFAKEIQLARQRGSDAASELRQRFFEEDQALESAARDFAASLGDDSQVGGSIQKAAIDLKSLFGAKRRAAYKRLSDIVQKSPELKDKVPLPTGRIEQAVKSAQEIIPANEAEANALDKLMAEFGLIGDKIDIGPRFTTVSFLDEAGNAVDSIKFRGKPENLNIGNAERFRQRINQIFDPKDPRQGAAKRQILQEYDAAMEELATNMTTSVPSEVKEAAKRARKIARAEKVAFDPKRIVDRISKANSDGNPLMDASKVYDEIRRSTTEDFGRLIEALNSGVEGGYGAINNLKSAALVDFVEQAIKTAKKTVSQEGASKNVFSGTNFKKAINKFGREKAKKLFGDDWARVQRLERISESRITPDVAVQKGSAPDLINNLINTFTRIGAKTPLVGSLAANITESAASKATDIIQEGAASRTLKEVVNLSPTRDQIDDYIVFSAKRLAASLGLAGATTSESID